MKKKKIIVLLLIFILIFTIFKIDSFGLKNKAQNLDKIDLEKNENNEKKENFKTLSKTNNNYVIQIKGGFRPRIIVKQSSGVGVDNGNWEIISKPFFRGREKKQTGKFFAGNGVEFNYRLKGLAFFGKISVIVKIGSETKIKNGIILFGIMIFK